MALPNIVIDGTQSYGSYDIAIVTEGVSTTYVFENVNITRPIEKAGDLLSTGAPNRQRGTVQQVTGTAVVQIGASGIRPQYGDVFSQAFDSRYGTEYFWLEPVPFEASNAPGEIRKMNVTFNKINGGRTTVTTA